MKKIKIFTVNIIMLVTIAVPLQAQQSDINTKDMFERQLDYVSRIVQLAEATPQEIYFWSPEEEVRSFGEVYTHIIQANYMILGSLGVTAPVDVQSIGSLTSKEDIVAAFKESIEFTKKSVQDLPDEKLSEEVDLFGQTINGEWALISMLNHMSEHAGQVIAYARVNDITPPWSE